ncbi:RPO31 [Ecytonucleospora hepatopenaei]|uniref:DNA-directed RNA polymerase subunit n=1 Tax=Ecytonucleospora hepatopenaei TaxID=646526 RepID=A0A1W0E754_9MICR|nr:RPO31 [Ecytonucleospora hepatopenaei]
MTDDYAIDKIEFKLITDGDINKMAVVDISNKLIHDVESRKPLAGGVLDLRLGVSTADNTCQTCKGGMAECPGHWGRIKLTLPLFHVSLIKETMLVLSCICKKCSSILLDKNINNNNLYSNINNDNNTNLYNNINNDNNLYSNEYINNIRELCKKQKYCYKCKSIQGSIKKGNGFKIFHYYKNTTINSNNNNLSNNNNNNILNNTSNNNTSNNTNNMITDELNPLTVLNLFNNISDDDKLLLGATNCISYLIQTLLVPPSCIRPSVDMKEEGFNEDDLTVKLSEIVNCNNLLEESIRKGASLNSISDDWDYLNIQVATYINADLPGIITSINSNTSSNTSNSKGKIRSLTHRIKGKQGRFRMNLSGKRVDFSGRTVISPDPNLSVEEVGIPMEICRELTVPEKVNRYNREYLQRIVDEDRANYIIREKNTTTTNNTNNILNSNISNNTNNILNTNISNNTNNILNNNTNISNNTNNNKFKIFLKYAKSHKVRLLRIGDIVERHLMDGDTVLFNRQPSLHRMSIMAHRVKTHSHRTLRFNVSVCAPYNADFDGDEMNIHVPQTKEAAAEAQELMGVRHNIRTVKSDEPLISPTQDIITGMYMLTQIDKYFTRQEYNDIIIHITNSNSNIYNSNNLYNSNIIPSISYNNINLYTGKQIVEYILYNIPIDKFISKNRKNELFMIVKNRYVCGTMDKNIIGGENKNTSIIEYILNNTNTDILNNTNNNTNLYNNTDILNNNILNNNNNILNNILNNNILLSNKDMCIMFINNISKISVRYLMEIGFSIGLDDIEMTNKVLDKKNILYNDIIDNILNNTDSTDILNNSNITTLLNKVREECGIYCINNLSRYNAAVVMSDCGSKGSKINVGQMVACVGQQVVQGKRIKGGMVGRTLPHSMILYNNNIYNDNNSNILYNDNIHNVIIDNIIFGGFVYNSFYSGLNAHEFFFHAVSGREGLVDTAVKTAETGYMQRRLMKSLEDLSVKYDGTVRNSHNNIISYTYDNIHNNNIYDNINNSNLYNSNLYNNIYNSKIDNNNNLYNIAAGAITAQSIGEPGTQMTLKTFHFAGVASMNITQGVPRLKEIINATPCISTPVVSITNIAHEEAMLLRNSIERKYLYEIIEKIEYNINTYDNIYNNLLYDNILYNNINSINNILYNNSNILYNNINSNNINSNNNLFYHIKLYLLYNNIYNYTDIYNTIINSSIFIDHNILYNINNNVIDIIYKYNTYTYNNIKNMILNIKVKGYDKVNKVIIKEITNSNNTNNSYNNKLNNNNLNNNNSKYNMFISSNDNLLNIFNNLYSNNHINSIITSNSILEVYRVLGIEAGRACIVREIKETMSSHGIEISDRHIQILADTMCSSGEVAGITRHGMKSKEKSTLMLASFEQSSDFLFSAAVEERVNKVRGVSECVILGKRINIGTGEVEIITNI